MTPARIVSGDGRWLAGAGEDGALDVARDARRRRSPVRATRIPQPDVILILKDEDEIVPELVVAATPEGRADVRASAVRTTLAILRDADPSERAELHADLQEHFIALGRAIEEVCRG